MTKPTLKQTALIALMTLVGILAAGSGGMLGARLIIEHAKSHPPKPASHAMGAAASPTWLDPLLGKIVALNGTPVPNEPEMNFISPMNVIDNPGNGSSDIYAPDGGGGGGGGGTVLPDGGIGAIWYQGDSGVTALSASTAGLALITNGPGVAPSYQSLSSALGWTTAFDCNITTQTTQTLSTDGSYTFCGLTWTRSNSANDHTAMQLTNGTGLAISPNSSAAYNGTSRTLPVVWTPLTGISVTWDWSTQVRLFVDESDNGTTTNDLAAMGFDTNTTAWDLIGFKGHNSGPAMLQKMIINGTNIFTNSVAIPSLGTSTETVLFIFKDTVTPVWDIFTGTAWSSGWPLPQNTTPWQASFGNEVGNLVSFIGDGGASAPGSYGVFLGGIATGTSDNPIFTYKHIRVDYR
jgi:hypothetical protein